MSFSTATPVNVNYPHQHKIRVMNDAGFIGYVGGPDFHDGVVFESPSRARERKLSLKATVGASM